jgi:hypothetical protein
MMMVAIFHLVCLALLLELVDRSPVIAIID